MRARHTSAFLSDCERVSSRVDDALIATLQGMLQTVQSMPLCDIHASACAKVRGWQNIISKYKQLHSATRGEH